jgi:transposase InsO family protein
MYCRSFHCLVPVARKAAEVLRRRLLAAIRPATDPRIAGTLADLVRTKPELIAKYALLRQQLIILRRSVKRPRCTAVDRTLLVLLASRLNICIWACDFLPVTDLLFRSIHAFFVIELATRRIVHVGVIHHPTDAWVTQQLREATPFGRHPKYLIRDNDSRFGLAITALAAAPGIDEVRTAYHAPKENACCERFLGSVRRECLDHLLILNEAHLRRILREYVAYYNSARPHQGLDQRIPAPPAASGRATGAVYAAPVLGGLHHTYARVA